MIYRHAKVKFKVGGQSIPKTLWKQTDGQTDGDDCITVPASLMRLATTVIHVHQQHQQQASESDSVHSSSGTSSDADASVPGTADVLAAVVVRASLDLVQAEDHSPADTSRNEPAHQQASSDRQQLTRNLLTVG